jgi:branched-chain amino acid transport system ATP-binding protein
VALLELRDVHAYYGNIHALKGISLTVDEGEIVTLIGSNGAGKSTTLKTISGLLRPRTGEIWFDGERLDLFGPAEIVRRGICQSPEGRRVFPRMTVRENLEMGAFQRPTGPEVDADFERVYGLFPRLKERMLAIGRALMAKPKLILLDEPSMGLAPILVEQIFDIIRDVNGQGTTVLLVEQNALMALGLASRGYILQTGEIVLADSAARLAQDPAVQKAYLGG